MKRTKSVLCICLTLTLLVLSMFSATAASITGSGSQQVLQMNVLRVDETNHTLLVDMKNVSENTLRSVNIIACITGGRFEFRQEVIDALAPAQSTLLCFQFSDTASMKQYKLFAWSDFSGLTPEEPPLTSEPKQSTYTITNYIADGVKISGNNLLTKIDADGKAGITLPLNEGYTYTYNGNVTNQPLSDVLSSIINVPSGIIRLVDADADGSYEKIEIEQYEALCVKSVKGETITSMDGKTLTLGSPYSITYQGKEIPLSSLQQYDVINYLTTSDGLFKATVTRSSISGTVTKVEQTNQVPFYTFSTGAQSYLNSSHTPSLEEGAEGTFYLDAFGSLIYWSVTEKNENVQLLDLFLVDSVAYQATNQGNILKITGYFTGSASQKTYTIPEEFPLGTKLVYQNGGYQLKQLNNIGEEIKKGTVLQFNSSSNNEMNALRVLFTIGETDFNTLFNGFKTGKLVSTKTQFTCGEVYQNKNNRLVIGNPESQNSLIVRGSDVPIALVTINTATGAIKFTPNASSADATVHQQNEDGSIQNGSMAFVRSFDDNPQEVILFQIK